MDSQNGALVVFPQSSASSNTILYAVVKPAAPDSSTQAVQTQRLRLPDICRHAPSLVLFSANTLPDLLRPDEKKEVVLAKMAESSGKDLLVARLRHVATKTGRALDTLDGRMKSDPVGYNKKIREDLMKEIRDMVLLDRIVAPSNEDSWAFPIESSDMSFATLEGTHAASQLAEARYVTFRHAFEAFGQDSSSSELLNGEATPNCPGSVYETFATKNKAKGVVHIAAANFARVALAVRVILERGDHPTFHPALKE